MIVTAMLHIDILKKIKLLIPLKKLKKCSTNLILTIPLFS